MRKVKRRKRGRPPKNDQLVVDLAAAFMEVSSHGLAFRNAPYANADDVSRRFYLSARRVREGVKDRIHNGDESRALTLIPDRSSSSLAPRRRVKRLRSASR